ncbi:hypothetical protein GCM10009552_38440 [Rothia nasimurium]
MPDGDLQLIVDADLVGVHHRGAGVLFRRWKAAASRGTGAKHDGCDEYGDAIPTLHDNHLPL